MLDINHHNVHIHSRDKMSLREHILKISSAYLNRAKDPAYQHLNPPEIVLTNHGYMYNTRVLRAIARQEGVLLTSGFGVKTSEGVELNILNPSAEAKVLLEVLSQDREAWLLRILNQLDYLGRSISPCSLTGRIGKKLREIEIGDICRELAHPDNDYPDCETPSMALSNYVRPVVNFIESIKRSFWDVHDLKNDHISLVEPEKWPELISEDCISSITWNKRTTGDIISLAAEKHKLALYGDGSWV